MDFIFAVKSSSSFPRMTSFRYNCWHNRYNSFTRNWYTCFRGAQRTSCEHYRNRIFRWEWEGMNTFTKTRACVLLGICKLPIRKKALLMLRVLLHWPLFSIHKTGCHLKVLFVFGVKKKKSQYLPISGGYKGTKSPFNKKFLPCTFSKHVGVLVICFGGCLECSWSKPKELQRRGSKGEANQLKTRDVPDLPPRFREILWLSLLTSPQLLSHTHSCFFLFVDYPPITSAPTCPQRRGPDPKWTSLVVLAGVQQPSHSPNVKMSQGHSRKLKTWQILHEAVSPGHPISNFSIPSTSSILDPPFPLYSSS